MIDVVKLKAEHLTELTGQSGLQHMKTFFSDTQKKNLEHSPYAFSGIAKGGRVVVCAGVSVLWENRGSAWAVFNPICRYEFLAIHNAVRRFLDSCPLHRIEAAVDVDFERGHRWAKLLGFELEVPTARKFLPSGNDASLYARVK